MKYFILLAITVCFVACKTTTSNTSIVVESNSQQKTVDKDIKTEESYTITPVEHATAVIEFAGRTIYIDPVGGIEKFEAFNEADAVFITHAHGDHLSVATLNAIKSNETVFVVPNSVATELPSELADKIIIMENGESGKVLDITIDAVAMYNIREEALKFHPKGAGNGYIFHLDDERVYFSGDTEDTVEMRALTNIDKAFVCMNMPYTMPVETAAEAVLAFKPKQVYPYHYRGQGGLSDVAGFKRIIEEGNESIEVIQWDWYPSN